MPHIFWTCLFLQAQGFNLTNNVVYQENQISIKLENNGHGSSGKRTCHINIHSFFVTDLVVKGDLTINYCPADMLIADFYTKPLQGRRFKLFRNLIMDIDDGPTKNFENAMKKLKFSTMSTPLCKSTFLECVGK